MTLLPRIFDFLRSKRLALALMLVILVVIFVATTILSVPVAQRTVFKALWFNGLLVLLVVNTACCFFSRIHRRGWTIVSTGMIIFHLSFVAMFTGIIIDSLFYFRGSLRLTQGETIRMGDPNGYDEAEWGRFYNHSRMHGEVTFHKLHDEYTVYGENKGVADEISIVDGVQQVKGVIYPTQSLAFNGFNFFMNKHGFAPLLVLYDKNGKEIYGAYTPLQSFKLRDKSMLYTTGTQQEGPGGIDFPQVANKPPIFKILFTFHQRKFKDDVAKSSFKVWEYDKEKKDGWGRFIFEGSAPEGETVSFGDYALAMKDVRYWASMDVLYNPGKPIVLASLWAGLAGVTLTTVGRLLRRGTRADKGETV